MQKVFLKWIDGLRFAVSDENKHSFIIDTKQEIGGNETGFQPVDLLLVSLAGCMGLDMVSILKKKRSDLKNMEIVVEAERGPEHPKRYTHITVKIKINKEVAEVDYQRAFELSHDKYCSILATLKTPPDIKFEFVTE